MEWSPSINFFKVKLCSDLNDLIKISNETFSNFYATHEYENLLEFEQKKNCDLILALSWPFFIGFWLRIPQNDRTDSPQKMAYSRSLSDQLIISNKA